MIFPKGCQELKRDDQCHQNCKRRENLRGNVGIVEIGLGKGTDSLRHARSRFCLGTEGCQTIDDHPHGSGLETKGQHAWLGAASCKVLEN